MAIPVISVVNRSTLLKSKDVGPVVQAVQTQVSRDFSPYWGLDCHLQFVNNPTNTDWVLFVVDSPEQADVLGYHTVERNLPYAYVYVMPDDKHEVANWSTTLSHEVLEMLADPWIKSLVQQNRKRLIGLEVADPTQDDRYAYKIGDVLVSDFCTPSWFGFNTSKPYDFCGKIKKPFQILPGGYIPVVGSTGKTKIGMAAGRTLADKKIPKYSRRWRRMYG